MSLLLGKSEQLDMLSRCQHSIPSEVALNRRMTSLELIQGLDSRVLPLLEYHRNPCQGAIVEFADSQA